MLRYQLLNDSNFGCRLPYEKEHGIQFFYQLNYLILFMDIQFAQYKQ